MLPRKHRLGTAADFAAVIKAGSRAGTSRLVLHVLISDRDGASRAGFVVSKKVGNSVVRHRVTRVLRPLVRARLDGLAPGTAVVVRALPSAAAATSIELDADLRVGMASAVRKAQSKSSARTRATAALESAKVPAGPAAPAEGAAT